MRIAYIASGAAGMLCGTCMHDNTLGAALLALGHEVAVIPTYTPLRVEERDVSRPEVFYGALNVYLEQSSALVRWIPRRLRDVLDRPRLLAWVSRFSVSTNAADLGPLTLSMLRGEAGNQKVELERLADWLATDFRPDVVHLSHSLFLGMARRIGERTGAAVVAGLSGEDLFIDGLASPWKARVIGEMRARAADVAAFVAPTQEYAQRMAELLAVPRERVAVARLGITLDGYPSPAAALPPRPAGTPLRVGYLARQCPEKGLHLLVEAFHLLRTMPDLPPVELVVAGYTSTRDQPYVADLRQRLDGWGLGGAVHWLGEVDRAGKLAMLGSLDVFSVPTIYREAKGLPVLEAMAAGVPVVQPRHGSFPELVKATGGGILVDPESAGALSRGLRTLLLDEGRRRQLGQAGREAVHRDFHTRAMAEDNLAAYRAVVSRSREVPT